MIILNTQRQEFFCKYLIVNRFMPDPVYSSEYPNAQEYKNILTAISKAKVLTQQTQEPHAVVKDYGWESEKIHFQTRIG